MWSHLPYEIGPADQPEIASPTINAHHRHDVRAITRPLFTVRHRRVPAIAAPGICLAATAAVTASGTQANPLLVKVHGRVSAPQLARETAALKARGFTPHRARPAGR